MKEIKTLANNNEKLNIINNKEEQNTQMFLIQNQSQKIEIEELNKKYNNILKEKEQLKQKFTKFLQMKIKQLMNILKKNENNLNKYKKIS